MSEDDTDRLDFAHKEDADTVEKGESVVIDGVQFDIRKGFDDEFDVKLSFVGGSFGNKEYLGAFEVIAHGNEASNNYDLVRIE